MLHKIAATAALLASVSLPMPLAAQTVDRDVRCWMVSNVFTQAEKDAKKKQIAGASSLYYLGRVDARLPRSQLKAAALAQAKTLRQQDVGPTMNACAKQFLESQQALQSLAGKPPARK